MTDFVTIYTTVPHPDEAKFIAQVVVSEKLAACANIVDGITSIYRWQGKIEEDQEISVLFKTSVDLVPKLTERIQELHSYECPCVVAWPILDGSPDYLAWLKAETD